MVGSRLILAVCGVAAVWKDRRLPALALTMLVVGMLFRDQLPPELGGLPPPAPGSLAIDGVEAR